MLRLHRVFLLAALLVLMTCGVALAGDTVILEGYEIRFLGAVDNGFTSTWTYAVTSSGDEAQAMSHWTLALQLEGCMTIVSPSEPGPYTTPTDHPYCAESGVNCVASTYTEVESGWDDTTEISGIKFGDADPQLSADPPATHIFAIELFGVPPDYQGEMPVGLKIGSGGSGGPDVGETGVITGPTCTPDPQAIGLAHFKTATPATPLVMLGLLCVALLFTGATVWHHKPS